MPEPTETKPLPAIAMSAWQLLQANFNRMTQELGAQIHALPDYAGWSIDFNTGTASRPKPPETPPETPPEASASRGH